MLGAAQSGSRRSLRLLSRAAPRGDHPRAREEATGLVDADPDLSGHPVLARVLAREFDPEHAEYLEKT